MKTNTLYQAYKHLLVDCISKNTFSMNGKYSAGRPRHSNVVLSSKCTGNQLPECTQTDHTYIIKFTSINHKTSGDISFPELR